MAHPSCKIKYSGKCWTCPFPIEERYKICKFFRSQMNRGVPWRNTPLYTG